jgi:predicted aconitase with swiveling domain
MPGGRGSSSSSTVLAESIRLGTAPAAIVLTEPDAIIALGAVIAFELYGIVLPVLLADPPSGIRTGDAVHLSDSGNLTHEPRSGSPGTATGGH